MEKLIYVLSGETDEVEGRVDRIAADVVPAAREVGAERMALFLPDEFETIGDRAPARLMGDFGRIAAIFPSVPRSPKPPGTSTASTSDKVAAGSAGSTVSLSMCRNTTSA